MIAGKDGGVQALPKKSGYEFPNYYHCATHHLNLNLATAAKVDQNVKQFLTTSTANLQQDSKTIETSSCVILIDELKNKVNNYNESLKKGLEMAEKYDINSFDHHSSSRRHRIPGSLKSTIVTSSVGHNKIATAEDMLALLWLIGGQVSGELCCRLGRNNYEVMKLVETCVLLKYNSMDAEPLNYAAVYDLIILDAGRDVFKNFIKRHEQATRFTLIDIYDLMQMDSLYFQIYSNFY